MECEYCGKNTATVEVPINEDESMHLCWFCAERKEEILREEVAIIRCENCIHKDRVSDYCMHLKREIKREDFCCHFVFGEHRNE